MTLAAQDEEELRGVIAVLEGNGLLFRRYLELDRHSLTLHGNMLKHAIDL